ncbi:MAG: hypothetical protein JRN38_04255, partial [Nitrososphaerota archaeon]|nr:hypothetical protein [Nitrososphaerota archaeon]
MDRAHPVQPARDREVGAPDHRRGVQEEQHHAPRAALQPHEEEQGGEQDLDQIMMAAVRGLDRASLEYPVRTGLIVCLDRTFDRKLNEILVDKAVLFSNRGVVGIDMAGPSARGFRYADYAATYRRARKAGLGLTVHAG